LLYKCGFTKKGNAFKSTSNAVKVVFQSDFGKNYKGWQLKWIGKLMV